MRNFQKYTPIDFHIAAKLKEFRMEKSISQKKLGDLSGLSYQQIQKYEAVENRISAAKLFEFAQILEKSIADFYTDFKSDGKYYAFSIKEEGGFRKNDSKISRDAIMLIRSFNLIKNNNIKKRILFLVKEIAGPLYEKNTKHKYS